MHTQSLDDALTDAMAVMTTIRVMAIALEPDFGATPDAEKARRDWLNLRAAMTGGVVKMVNAIEALREKPTWAEALEEPVVVVRSVVANLRPGQMEAIVQYPPTRNLWMERLLDPERPKDKRMRERIAAEVAREEEELEAALEEVEDLLSSAGGPVEVPIREVDSVIVGSISELQTPTPDLPPITSGACR